LQSMAIELSGYSILGRKVVDSHGFGGRRVGYVCDLLINPESWLLSFVVVARFYLSPLRLGFIRTVVPIEMLQITQKISIRTSLKYFKLIRRTTAGLEKALMLERTERSFAKKDLLKFTLPILVLAALFVLAFLIPYPAKVLICSFIVALIILYPSMLYDTLHWEKPWISCRYLTMRKIFDKNLKLVGLAADFSFDASTFKVNRILVANPGLISHLPSWLGRFYATKGGFFVPIAAIETIKEYEIQLNMGIEELRKLVEE